VAARKVRFAATAIEAARDAGRLCMCCSTTKSRRTSGQRPRAPWPISQGARVRRVSAGAIDRRSVQAAWLGQRM